MAGKKIKSKSGSKQKKGGGVGGGGRKKKTGPQLPNMLKKELDLMNSKHLHSDVDVNDDEEIDSDDEAINDVYEYEEAVPEEESRKNRRYDEVDNYEYELPQDFKDENIESDDDEEQSDEEDGGRHARMLEEITGVHADAFEGKRNHSIVVSEPHPESEYNPTRDVLDRGSRIEVDDLLDGIQGKSGFSKLRKSINRVGGKSTTIQAPLPKPDQEKINRQASYTYSKKEMDKWIDLTKRNREASTLYFDEKIDSGSSTVGAIASNFKFRTEFEKKIAGLVNANEVAEAHSKDGARLLELNKISVEDVKGRQDYMAKMRSILFRHEIKATRIKKIKSKAYHRLLKKDRLKAVGAAFEKDPEAAKEHARKQEFKRAEERLTLKHKNSSKWAKRIINRGLSVQDEGTRAAISEQLNQHALLTRKMNSMKNNSSSDDSSDGDDGDDFSDVSDQEGGAKLLEKAKAKTLEVLEEDELPKSGVFSLPFMVRGLKKRKEAADEEAKLALQEYEVSLKQLENKSEVGSLRPGTSTGRWVFGAPNQQVQKSTSNKMKLDNHYGNSTDSEEDFEAKEDADDGHGRRNYLYKDVNIDPDLFREESEVSHDHLFKSFDDIVKEPGSKTTYEVSVFASNSWKKKKNIPESEQLKSGKGMDEDVKNSSQVMEPALSDQEKQEIDDDSDTDDDGQMVDGVLSSDVKSTYELPSQSDLIRRAFAGDDVEEDFEKSKEEILNEENPEPEKPVLLPGWGQWTHIQKKRGLPSWMVKDHEDAKKKREEALKKRKDARLKHVIISEKVDKKADKLHTKTLPFPYKSKEVFEQSIRMPIGPEFNPATTVGALIRPDVVKKSGVIIKPIQFKEVNPHERTEESKHSGQKRKGKSSGKAMKKMKTKGEKAN